MREFVSAVLVDEVKRQRGHNEYIVKISPRYNLSGRDLMLKGGKFYAVLDNETNMWSTKELDAFKKIDDKLYLKRESIGSEDGYGTWRTKDGDEIVLNTLTNSRSKELVNYRTWESKLPVDFNYHQLDSKLTFIDDKIKPEDYRSRRLQYKLEESSIESYKALMSVLYAPEELQKLEWAIGSIYAGDSVNIEKIIVLYGDPGTGKSTVLDLIKQLFDGYWAPFVADDLARKSDQFATSVFKDNPLLAIQDDGSLAKIESPVINEIVSHKDIIVNEKGKQRYHIRPNAMLFLATNELVDIHDTKLGISRRLLDIYPTGNKLPVREYRRLVSQLKFELSGIAWHCLQVYKSLGPEYYLGYSPLQMIDKTNIMRNFVFDNYERLVNNDPVTRNVVYDWYKEYFEESGLGYPPKRILFGEQLKEYYREYDKIKWCDGKSRRHVYSGFKREQFAGEENDQIEKVLEVTDKTNDIPDWLDLHKWEYDKLSKLYPDIPAQYAKGEKDIPEKSWDKCNTTLHDILSDRVHYCLTQAAEPNLVVIDFDIHGEDGKKSFSKNVEEASKWPKTYAELSKGGEGIHLHYIYNGDVTQLSPVYSPNVEVKVFTGKQALRRRLSKCNDLDISVLQPGSLPLKGDKKKVLDWEGVKDEDHLRNIIRKDLRKGSFPSTVQSVKHICDVIEDAYSKGIKYDVSDMHNDILAFASCSTHNAKECLKEIRDIHWKSDDLPEPIEFEKEDIIFYDVEVFPNLFICCYKKLGASEVIPMVNPSPDDIRELCKYKLVGFNNRRYDNHILYAWMQGYTNKQLFEVSQNIIKGSKTAFFGNAYNLSYTDIYDFSAKKQSLKKFEIELGIHHQENHYAWDQPVPKEHWNEIVEYCCNDVRATEAVWNARYADFEARKSLAKVAGGTPNDTTNSLTTKLIFGNNKHPQSEFVYTDLSTIFPGYEFKNGKSIYHGEEVGEGGYVWADHGMWVHVKTFDVASMHPHSAIALNIFGDRYTAVFKDLVDARIAIKHKDKEALKTLFNGAFAEYADAPDDELKNLAQALKIAINSVYGLTSAKFDNPFRDPRNVDNIVAKRGALFMVTLKEKVMEMGGHVVHIKTDSIKVENPSEEIEKFIIDFGKQYGYDFEVESKYERMCLVNNAVYIAMKELDDPDYAKDLEKAKKKGLPDPTRWTATGAQFAQPYVFKTLFSHEPIEFKDMCETRNVTTSLYLDFNEGLTEDQHNYHFVGKIGQFTPIAPGKGGGVLLRANDDATKFSSAPNSKGYRWMESEAVKSLNKEKDIDITFYRNLVDDAKQAIKDNCKTEDEANWFISGEPNLLEMDSLPF